MVKELRILQCMILSFPFLTQYRRLGDDDAKLVPLFERLQNPMEEWKNAAVCHFFSSIGLSKYYKIIKKSKVEGSPIREWTEQQWKELGISDDKDIATILQNVKIYKERPKNGTSLLLVTG